MSAFQVHIKTNKPLDQLASEICTLLSLPPYKMDDFAGDPYYQYEMLGMLILLHPTDEEDRDPEVLHYPYSFDLQFSFSEHHLDIDNMEYHLQPYFAHLLSFQLDVETAYYEKQKVEKRWQIRYHFCRKNPHWTGHILYGEPGWQPGTIESSPSEWRSLHPVF